MRIHKKTQWLSLLLLGLAIKSQAASHVLAFSVRSATVSTASSPVSPSLLSQEASMRMLRLQDAVDNGDLTPQEARKIMKNYNKYYKHNGYSYPSSSQPVATIPNGDPDNRLRLNECHHSILLPSTN